MNFVKTVEEKLLVLSEIARRLNEAGITWAIGASALLYFHRITDEFHDLDVMVDEKDALSAKEILLAMGTLHPSEGEGKYRTKYFFEFSVDGVEVDLIGGFAILKDGAAYDCGLDASQIVGSTTVNGQAVPLQSVQVWRRYYELMGRPAKVALIDGSCQTA